MGDDPPSSGPADEHPSRDAPPSSPHGAVLVDSHTNNPQDRESVGLQASYPRQILDTSQYTFPPQYPMALPPGPPRTGPYDMGAVMNALPPSNFRQGQLGPGPQGFQTLPSPPNTAGPIQLVPHYAGQALMNTLPSQQFYPPQHAHVSQYYGTAMLSSQQPGNSMSSRPMIGFYPTPMAMNNQQPLPPATYYYSSSTTQFPTQSLHVQNQVPAGRQLASTRPGFHPGLEPRPPRHQTGDQAEHTPPLHTESQQSCEP